jgi:hypothetical protein
VSGSRFTLVALVVAAGLSAGTASAASLGGLTARSLLSVNHSGAPSPPSVLGCDNFTGTSGTSMAGRTVAVASSCSSLTWTAHVGTWTIQTNQGASSATASAVTTLNTSFVNGSIQVVLANLNTSGRSGGLVLAHDGASTYLAAVMIDGSPDRIELRLVTSGSSVVLATVNPTFATTNTLRMSRSGSSSITVTLNSATVMTHTLSGAQQTTLGTNGRSGLFGGSSSVRFDNLVATNP